MESRNEQLVSLFRSIFTASGLVRFVRTNFGTRFARLVLKKGSESGQIRKIVEDLVEKDLINDWLFNALVDFDPDKADLINRVRGEFVSPVEASEGATDISQETALRGHSESAEGFAETASEKDEFSEERLAWRRRLKASLQDYSSEIPAKPDAWLAAAAVLPDFDPIKLRPYAVEESSVESGGLVSLAAYCHKRSDGRWELELRDRRDSLAKLWRDGELGAAIECNSHEHSVHTELLMRLSDSYPLPFRSIANYETLLAAIDISDWLTGISAELFNVDRVHAAVERYERIEPLRKLVGTHFRGRRDELEQLRGHALDSSGSSPILTMRGIGGAGKSTVLGKHLLDFDAETELSRPWAYLDFDDPSIDPTNQAGLIERIARHIGLLYAGVDISDEESALESAFIAVESASSADFVSDVSFELAADTTDSKELIRSLSDAIHALPMGPSLLLVLDTFEQVQARGSHAIALTRELLNQIIEEMPFVRIIISGRGAVAQWQDTEELLIGDLDDDSADQVLLALGVERAQTRETIVGRLGTNPLTLRLIADGIRSGRLSDDDLEHLVVGARSLELQGHLYTRILGHIQDGEVRRLAHPGLVVRRVTRGVIKDVLADICEIDVTKIDSLFDRLPDTVALFEPDEAIPQEGRALRHRQDVREKMLRLMVEDPIWHRRLEVIHTRAIEHYQKMEHPIAGTEELYHRLMRDDDPEVLDALWSEDKAASLGRSWDEPFPERAKLWLGVRLGYLQADAIANLRVADREVVIIRDVESHLKNEDFFGALKLIQSMPERSSSSRLYVLEASALTRLGRHKDALNAASRGLAAIAEADYPRLTMELHQSAARSALEISDYDVHKRHSGAAIRLANALDDTNANLLMLDLQVRAELKQGDTKEAVDSAHELESVFLNANERELRNLPDVSEVVVSTLGANSRNVLRKAAVTFGNRESQTVINQDVFQLEQLLQQAKESGAAQTDLAQLATQVGLPSKDYSMVDLAGAAIRYGRMGDAMAVVLDHAGNNQDVRTATMSMFNLDKGIL